MSDFFVKLTQRASQHPRTIVLPEGADARTIDAAATILEMGFAKLVILGDVDTLRDQLSQKGTDLSQVQLFDPKNDPKREEFAQTLYDLRKEKGMTLEKASAIVTDEIYFGTMLVKSGLADGLVAGA